MFIKTFGHTIWKKVIIYIKHHFIKLENPLKDEILWFAVNFN